MGERVGEPGARAAGVTLRQVAISLIVADLVDECVDRILRTDQIERVGKRCGGVYVSKTTGHAILQPQRNDVCPVGVPEVMNLIDPAIVGRSKFEQRTSEIFSNRVEIVDRQDRDRPQDERHVGIDIGGICRRNGGLDLGSNRGITRRHTGIAAEDNPRLVIEQDEDVLHRRIWGHCCHCKRFRIDLGKRPGCGSSFNYVVEPVSVARSHGIGRARKTIYCVDR